MFRRWRSRMIIMKDRRWRGEGKVFVVLFRRLSVVEK